MAQIVNLHINGEWIVNNKFLNILPHEGTFMVIFIRHKRVTPEYCIVELKDVEIL